MSDTPQSFPGAMPAEYAAALLSARITATIACCTAIGLLFLANSSVPDCQAIFESAIKGGDTALSPLTRLALGLHNSLPTGASCLSLALLGVMWTLTRRVHVAIWLGFVATMISLLTAALLFFALFVPLLIHKSTI